MSVVEVVDHGGQGGRFARAGGTGHQHQTTRDFDDLLEYRWCAQLFKGRYPKGMTQKTAAAPRCCLKALELFPL